MPHLQLIASCQTFLRSWLSSSGDGAEMGIRGELLARPSYMAASIEPGALTTRPVTDIEESSAHVCGPAALALLRMITPLFLVCIAVPAAAQITAQDNYDPYIRDRTTIATIDEDTAFGDRTDINTGETNFYVTVASLQGNNSLEVALRYKYVRDRSSMGGAWIWEQDDPYIAGGFAVETGWVLGESWSPAALRSTARCTGTGLASGTHMPPALNTADGKPGYWYPYEYYNGIRLVLPRGGGAVLIPGGYYAAPSPSQGGPYQLVTNDGWFFSCIPLKNGPGEGFLGLAPDGTKYYFDDFRPGPDLPTLNKRNVGDKDIDLERREYRIYASRIEDRFGNYVEGLSASDGRVITTIDLGGGILRVIAGTQQWTVARGAPFTVTNPDGSQWKMASNWSGLQWRGGGAAGDPGDLCVPARPLAEFTGSATLTVTVPSGAIASFDFAPIQRGFSYVPLGCYRPEGALDNGNAFINPSLVTEISLTKKTVSGPGIAPHWTQMSYSSPNDCFAPIGGNSGSCTASSPTTVTTKLARSDGTYAIYTFGNRSYVNQGQLLRIEEGVAPNTPLKVTNQQWQLFAPVSSGITGLSSTSASLSTIKRMTVVKRDVIQDGRKFTWEIASNCGTGSNVCVDQLIRPTKVVKGSALSP